MMSTLIVTKHTAVDLIPVGNRIAEIIKDKGIAFSQSATAKRLGIGRETFRLMLNGEREIYTFELDKICRELRVSIQRLTQEDIKERVLELETLLYEMTNTQKAIDLAQELVEVSLGMTEKCLALRRLGMAYFDARRYEESHRVFLEAHELAKSISEKYGKTDVLYKILFHLMDTFTAKKDYVSASHILESVEVAFQLSPHRLAAIYSSHSQIKESLGDLEEARKFAYNAMDYAEQSGKQLLIGQVANNVAHFEYKLRNFHRAQMYQMKAISALESNKSFQVIVKKEYIKTLLKLNEYESANTVIEATMLEPILSENNALKGKMLLLLAKAKNEPQHAQSVLEQEHYDPKVRYLACKYLMEYFKNQNDSTKFMHYYKIAETFSGNFSDFLDEGDL